MMTGGPPPYRSNAITVPSADATVSISALPSARLAGPELKGPLAHGPPADVIAYDFAGSPPEAPDSPGHARVLGGQLYPGIDTELGEDAAQAAIDSVRRNAKPGRGLAIGHPGGDQGS